MTTPGIPDPNQQPSYLAPPRGYQPSIGVPPKRNKALLIAGVVVATLVVLFGTSGCTVTLGSDATKVGSCLKITSSTMTPPKEEPEDCSSTAAFYVITETGGTDMVCDPKENSVGWGEGSRSCLRWNLAVGECAQFSDGTSVPKKLDCANPGSKSSEKLAALITDSSDKSKCPAGATDNVSNVKRNMVYCFGPIS